MIKNTAFLYLSNKLRKKQRASFVCIKLNEKICGLIL